MIFKNCIILLFYLPELRLPACCILGCCPTTFPNRDRAWSFHNRFSKLINLLVGEDDIFLNHYGFSFNEYLD